MFEIRINYLPMQATIWQDKYATFWSARSLQRPFSSDRKSTRLNSSHSQISYAVFCLKKKTNMIGTHYTRTYFKFVSVYKPLDIIMFIPSPPVRLFSAIIAMF